MESILTKNQKKVFGPKVYNNGKERMTVRIRHDDECGNGHNSFSIVCDIEEKHGNRWVDIGGGAAHEEIVKHFPELKPFIKWHLCSTDGPLHYIANTLYWARQGNLDYARNSAIWLNASLDNLLDVTALQNRLPALMDEFRKAVESLGFVY